MKTYLLTILGASTANIITFILYQGFVKSYLGKNCIEEVTRGTNNLRLKFQFYISKKRKCAVCEKTFKPGYIKQEYCNTCIVENYSSFKNKK